MYLENIGPQYCPTSHYGLCQGQFLWCPHVQLFESVSTHPCDIDKKQTIAR